MSKLSLILSNEKVISEKEDIIEPIKKEIECIKTKNYDLIYEFLLETLEKRKKYYLNDSHYMKWFMFTSHKYDKDAKKYGHSQLFSIEHRANSRKSIIFKDIVTVYELYDLFKCANVFKTIARESNIKNVLDD